MSMFVPGDAVVCIDAADIPSPQHAKYQVRLWGISNPIHPVFHVEMGYAETRFEKIESASKSITQENEEILKEAA